MHSANKETDSWLLDLMQAASSYGLIDLQNIGYHALDPCQKLRESAYFLCDLRSRAEDDDPAAREFFRLFNRYYGPPWSPTRKTSPQDLPGDLAVVTSYYNPAGYKTRRINYERFAEGLREQGVELWTVEAAFGDQDFELSPGCRTLQLRGRDALWQKEQLLNQLIKRLPDRIDKVAWVDADVLFENTMWPHQASLLLQDFQVIQLFDTVEFLGPDGDLTEWAFGRNNSKGVIASQGENFTSTHPGFSWAARRSLLAKHGLCCDQIAGSGDAVMSLAFLGRLDHGQFHRYSREMRAAFIRWAGPVFEDVRGCVSWVPGTIKHMWHGSHADRKYDERLEMVKAAGFSPNRHIKENAEGVWEWTDSAPADLKEGVSQYFSGRSEDVPEAPESVPITCVMITGKHPGRVPAAREAVRAWENQNYADKRLLIINDGLLPILTRSIEGAEEVRISKGIETLGGLRNLAIDLSKTDCLVQWDDDDLSHHSRLRYQVRFWKPSSVVIFRREVHRNDLTGEQVVADASTWDSGGFPGTMMFDKRIAGHFPRMSKGEDTVFIKAFKRRGVLDIIDNPAWMYVRRYNGLNTWDESHIIHQVKAQGAKNLSESEAAIVAEIIERNCDERTTQRG